MRLTFDTNALLSATLWEGSVAQKLLTCCIRRQDIIYISMQIISEYREVLLRDFDYSESYAARIIEKVLEFTTLIEPTSKINVVADDPDDNMVIECAVDSKSEGIITYDRHLLKIGVYQNIKILKPEDALKLV